MKLKQRFIETWHCVDALNSAKEWSEEIHTQIIRQYSNKTISLSPFRTECLSRTKLIRRKSLNTSCRNYLGPNKSWPLSRCIRLPRPASLALNKDCSIRQQLPINSSWHTLTKPMPMGNEWSTELRSKISIIGGPILLKAFQRRMLRLLTSKAHSLSKGSVADAVSINAGNEKINILKERREPPTLHHC